MKQKMKKFLGILFVIVLMVVAIGGIVVMTLNNHVVKKGKADLVQVVDSKDITFSKETKKAIKKLDPECVMILGCGITDSETPSPMLRDRLDVGLALYQAGLVNKILVTGDNGTTEHNELHVMMKYLEDRGVPGEDIFCDHAGFSTSDSMHRATKIFEVKRMVVVTQEYHLYRALYLADKCGIDALGVASNQRSYVGQPARELREVLARNKDYFAVLLKKDSSIGGEVIPISGDGSPSHGE